MIIFNLSTIPVALLSLLPMFLAGKLLGGEAGAGLGFEMGLIGFGIAAYQLGYTPTLFWIIPLPLIGALMLFPEVHKLYGIGGDALAVVTALAGIAGLAFAIETYRNGGVSASTMTAASSPALVPAAATVAAPSRESIVREG